MLRENSCKFSPVFHDRIKSYNLHELSERKGCTKLLSQAKYSFFPEEIISEHRFHFHVG